MLLHVSGSSFDNKLFKAAIEILQCPILRFNGAYTSEKLNSLINLYNESRDFYTKSPEGLSNFYLENKKVSNKVASLAIAASAIMNLDEFLTHG